MYSFYQHIIYVIFIFNIIHNKYYMKRIERLDEKK